MKALEDRIAIARVSGTATVAASHGRIAWIVVLICAALTTVFASVAVANPADPSSATPRSADPRADGDDGESVATPGTGPSDRSTIITPRGETEVSRVPAAASIVQRQDIQDAQPQLGLGESLSGVPGVFVQNRYNFAQDLRIAIRGFGARSAFGIRGVRILMDGIPETLPDGQAQVDNVDLGSASRLELLRGPSSALYGNASGGVLHIVTEDPPVAPHLESRFTGGSYGFLQTQAKAGVPIGKVRSLLSLSRMEIDGYRDHSRSERYLANGKVLYESDSGSRITTLANFVSSGQADDAGGLTREEAATDPAQARDRNLQFDAGERVVQGRIGIRYEQPVGTQGNLAGSLFGTVREFSNKLPFQGGGQVELSRLFGGGSMRYSHKSRLVGLDSHLVLGIDVGRQRDKRLRYDNDDGQRGLLAFNQIESVLGVGSFAQGELSLTDRITLTLGARIDRILFEATDLFMSQGDASGQRVLTEVSPTVGALYRIASAANVYGNVSTSFETPTTTEFANPSGLGGFNPDLKSQRAINFELGVKSALGPRWHYELAGFAVQMREELVPFELEDNPGRTFYRNAGRSSRYGLEAGLKARPARGLTLGASYTYSEFRFDDFAIDTASFDGNRIPGIPRHQAKASAFYKAPMGLFVAPELVFIGALFADNANEERIASYALSNLRMGYQKTLGEWRLAPFVALNNLLDADYNDNIRINAFGARHFEPAPGFNYVAGFSVAYSMGRVSLQR